MAERIDIGGRLHSTETGNVVAGANEIYDDAKGKKQSVVNQETDASLADRYTKAETYNKTELNNMITTPNQEYETYNATDQTTDVTDVLPATGEADTVYRVGNWDGSQFDASVYSEYAWNGSSYVHLSTKTQIGEVFDISAYHATGGTLATYADLSAALDSNNGGGVPQSLQKGGMSVKYVRTYDNKYIQARCMAQNFTTDVTQWQEVNKNREISILFIGNSLQEDVTAYLPLLMKETGGIDFNIYNWYIGGATMSEHLAAFNNDTPCTRFNIWRTNEEAWTIEKDNDAPTIDEVFDRIDVDAVCLEDSFNSVSSPANYNIQPLKDVISYIEAHYTKPVKFVTLFHALSRSNLETYNSLWVTETACIKRILAETAVTSVIPAGEAINEAMKNPTLDALGRNGHLSWDGVHAQEGTPCMIQTYVLAQWIYDHFGLSKSFMGSKVKLTYTDLVSYNIPGQNPPTTEHMEPVGMDDSTLALAQDVAMKAYRKYMEYFLCDKFATGESINEVGIDNTPTAGSKNLATSGGVFANINRLVGNYEKEFSQYTSSQMRSYLYGSFKNGDKVKIWATGTAVTSSIIIRYDDGTTNIVGGISNNGEAKIVTLNRDTTCLIALVNNSNISTEGTIIFHVEYGYALRLETDETPIKDSKRLVESGGVFDGLSKIGVFDVSAYNEGELYFSLADVIVGGKIPSQFKRGGMTIKYAESIGTNYKLELDENVSDYGTATPLTNNNYPIITAASDALKAGDILTISDVNKAQIWNAVRLLTTESGSNSVKFSVSKTVSGQTVYDVWTITKMSADTTVYKQYRYTKDSAATGDIFNNAGNWQGIDENVAKGSHNLIESNGVAIEGEKCNILSSAADNADTYYGIMSVYFSLPFKRMTLTQYYNKEVASNGNYQRIMVSVVFNDDTSYNYIYSGTEAGPRSGVEEISLIKSSSTAPDADFKITVNWQYIINQNYINVPINKNKVSCDCEYPLVVKSLVKGLNGVSGLYYGFLNSSGNLVSHSRYKVTGYIDVSNVKQYSRSMIQSGNACDIVYDADYNVIKAISESDGRTINLPTNAKYIRMSVIGSIYVNVIEVYSDDVSQDGFTTIENKQRVNILSADDFSDGFLKSDNTVTSSTSYKHTGYIPVKGGVEYSYSGWISGAACILLFDKYFNKYTYYSEGDTISTIIPDKDGYIRISSTNVDVTLTPGTNVAMGFLAVDKDSKDYNLRDFISESNTYAKKLNKASDKYRLSVDFMIDGYAEQSGDYDIAVLNGDLHILMNGAPNSRLSYLDIDEQITSTYPLPKRNVSFKTKFDNTILGSWTNKGLPLYREIIGDDIFRMRYISSNIAEGVDSVTVQTEYAALSDVLDLSFVGGILKVHNSATDTDILNINTSSYQTVGDLVAYINANYTNFVIEILGNSDTLVSDLAPINDVTLVSVWKKNHVSDSATRHEAYYCYFQKKVDSHVHNLEIVMDDKFYAVIDGEPIISSDIKVNLESILLGSNGACPITPIRVELNCGYIGDAEPQGNRRIVSKYNPNVVAMMGHPVYAGDECDGLKPVFMDETPGTGEAAVVPVKYKNPPSNDSIPYTNSLNAIKTATSTGRIRRIIKLAQEKGYKFVKAKDFAAINEGTLPKRCCVWIFDDEEQYFFDDLNIRAAFASGVESMPSLAVQFYDSLLANEDYLPKQRMLDRANWESTMHGYYMVNVCTMSAEELYDIDSQNSSDSKMFNRQVVEANPVLDWSVWTYSNGSANPNTIKAFEHNGVQCGFMTEASKDGSGAYRYNQVMLSRAINKYYILRVNIAEYRQFDTLVAPVFV